MIPTFSQMQRGKQFTRVLGETVIRFHKKGVLYLVSINGAAIGHTTYDLAVRHLVHELVIQGGKYSNGRRKQQDN